MEIECISPLKETTCSGNIYSISFICYTVFTFLHLGTVRVHTLPFSIKNNTLFYANLKAIYMFKYVFNYVPNQIILYLVTEIAVRIQLNRH